MTHTDALNRTDDQYRAFYRTYFDEVYSRFNNRERPAPFYLSDSGMRLWLSLGMVYETDGDQGATRRYGLTEAGSTVRGWRQMKSAAEAHAAEMERRRKMIVE